MDPYNRQIIAVDFDKTLSMARWPEVGEPNVKLFSFLKLKQAAGARIILNTCRTGEPLENAVEFCKENGLVFDAVNENLPEMIEKYGNDCRKISADVYIDDRAMNLQDVYRVINIINGIKMA